MNLKRTAIKIKTCLILILFSSVVSGQQTNTIYIVDSYINVSRSVSCENFESSFADIINRIELKKIKTKKIIKILKSLPKLDQQLPIDVRYKGIIQDNSAKLFFCGDEVSVNVNGQFYKSTLALNKFLNNLIK